VAGHVGWAGWLGGWVAGWLGLVAGLGGWAGWLAPSINCANSHFATGESHLNLQNAFHNNKASSSHFMLSSATNYRHNAYKERSISVSAPLSQFLGFRIKSAFFSFPPRFQAITMFSFILRSSLLEHYGGRDSGAGSKLLTSLRWASPLSLMFCCHSLRHPEMWGGPITTASPSEALIGFHKDETCGEVSSLEHLELITRQGTATPAFWYRKKRT
jgi:hypothetical protein